MTIIGHIFDAWAKVADGVMPKWEDILMTDKVDKKNKVSLEHCTKNEVFHSGLLQ